MAAIDKIYGTTEQYDELKQWLGNKKPGAIKYLYPRDYGDIPDRPISNFPQNIDRWLYDNCPIKWVIDRIKDQYNGKRP